VVTDVITDPRFGENFIVKIRWFVVVQEGDNSCTCLYVVRQANVNAVLMSLDQYILTEGRAWVSKALKRITMP
jgi:hypothetical protein